MATVKEGLAEAQAKIRKIKGALFRAMDYDNPIKLKEEMMKVIKEL